MHSAPHPGEQQPRDLGVAAGGGDQQRCAAADLGPDRIGRNPGVEKAADHRGVTAAGREEDRRPALAVGAFRIGAGGEEHRRYRLGARDGGGAQGIVEIRGRRALRRGAEEEPHAGGVAAAGQLAEQRRAGRQAR